jgi:hypothetical protein
MRGLGREQVGQDLGDRAAPLDACGDRVVEGAGL